MSTTNTAGPNNPYTDFQAGVTAALRSWSALRTAVEQQWGGTGSASKAEELRSNIFTFFDGTTPNPKMTLDELEDNLFGYIEEEFGVVLEDGSERQVADLICRMYEMCAKGDSALAREVVQNAIKAEELLQQSNVKTVIQSGEDGDEDDDMDDDSDVEGDAAGTNTTMEGETVGQQQPVQVMMMNGAAENVALTYASETLFGGPPKPKKDLPPPRQLGDLEPEKPQPVVDDDGFAAVATKRKGKRR
mmetsp:Transcript_33263/g.59907  ORF Transcript_33263/g.59907 Transcript_33263/m.59907 type:complete len:246 (-) Transcript_33263:145-882(-)